MPNNALVFKGAYGMGYGLEDQDVIVEVHDCEVILRLPHDKVIKLSMQEFRIFANFVLDEEEAHYASLSEEREEQEREFAEVQYGVDGHWHHGIEWSKFHE